MALKYITSPMTERYESKASALFGPAAIIVFFLYSSLDILCLGVFVFGLNILVTWRLLDGDQTSHKSGKSTNYRYSENKAVEFLASSMESMNPFPHAATFR